MAYYDTFQYYTSREYRLLHALQGVEVPAEAKAVLDDIRRSVDAQTQRDQRQRAEVKREHDARQAVLDADQPIAKGSLTGRERLCVARLKGGSWRSTCHNDAKWLRTWTTKEFDGLYLDGKKVEQDPQSRELVVPGGWELGKGFVNRPLTEEEDARAERRYKTVEHSAKLCGNHRLVKGDFGLPY